MAAIGNLTMPEKVILSGEGIRLAVVGQDALHRGLQEHRSRYASPLDLEVQPTGFVEWPAAPPSPRSRPSSSAAAAPPLTVPPEERAGARTGGLAYAGTVRIAGTTNGRLVRRRHVDLCRTHTATCR